MPRRVPYESALAILVFLAALGGELALVHIGLDPQDEGYFVEQASRVVRGDVPYRDFDSLYTPGLLYVHAGLFHMLGSPDLIAVRAFGLITRAVLAGGLYALARPIARPMFAVLPGLYVLVALDRVPLAWEPHPGWLSAALTVLAVLAFSRLPRVSHRRRQRWLVMIGALIGLVFACKQNAGVFLAMALIAYTAWGGVRGTAGAVTRPMRVTQIVLLSLIVLAVMWLIRAHASPVVAAYFLLPIVAAGVACRCGMNVDSSGGSVRSWFTQLALLGLGFGAVTLPWLVALIVALNGQIGLLGGFVGAVDQDFLWHPLDGPTTGAWASLVGTGVALLLAIRVRRRGPLFVVGVTCATAFMWSAALLTAQAGEPVWRAVLLALPRASDGLPVVLPVVCIGSGAWCAVRSQNSPAGWHLRWLTAASALTLLAEFPRMDEAHLAWSACLALTTGAVVLGRAFAILIDRWSLRGLGRAALYATLLVVPVTTSLPNLGARAYGMIETSDDGGWRRAPLATVTGLPGFNGVQVTGAQAASLVAAAIYVRDMTEPGEPIFAYPTSPLVYVMADRPNATRFAHLYPGAASEAQLNEVLNTLDQLPVRIVVVSAAGLLFWGPPRQNQPLEDYLAAHYRESARFGEFRVLIRGDAQG
jgi:hypothetical protein